MPDWFYSRWMGYTLIVLLWFASAWQIVTTVRLIIDDRWGFAICSALGLLVEFLVAVLVATALANDK